MRSRVNGVNDQTIIAYDSLNHRHWRIRHDSTANMVNFETSADGTVWITRKTATPGFALTSLRIYLVAGAYGTGNGAPGAARYDNLKLLSSSGGPSAITVPNSGFETPSLGFGNFQYGPTGGSWNFINGAGISAGGSGFAGGSFVPEGSQVAFIQSNGEFSQSLSGFQANTNYVVTFFAAQRTNCCNADGQQFAVYRDGTLLGTFNPPLNGVYVEYSTAAFTTTTGSHTLKFVGLNPGGQAGFIDHVRLTGSPVVGNGVQWLVSDHLGTPRMILDESGSLGGVKRHDYLPFGEDLFGGTPSNPGLGGRLTDHGYTMGDSVRQQYTSKERDLETSLDYFGARYYSAKQGRFTSVDPLMASAIAVEPQSWNRYAFVSNNPLRFVDDDGQIKRDQNGNIIFDPVGQPVVTIHPSGTLNTYQFGYIYADNGDRIEALQNLSNDTRFDTDCHGLSFADGLYWINDNQVQTLLTGDGYQRVHEPQVGDIVVYTVNGEVRHSTTVVGIENGQVTVAGLGGLEPASSTTTVQAAWPTGRPTYYRRTNDDRTPAERQGQAERVRTHNKANARIGIEIERQIGPPPPPPPPAPRPKKGKKGANEDQS